LRRHAAIVMQFTSITSIRLVANTK